MSASACSLTISARTAARDTRSLSIERFSSEGGTSPASTGRGSVRAFRTGVARGPVLAARRGAARGGFVGAGVLAALSLVMAMHLGE
jgi:hypothetical protein